MHSLKVKSFIRNNIDLMMYIIINYTATSLCNNDDSFLNIDKDY